MLLLLQTRLRTCGRRHACVLSAALPGQRLPDARPHHPTRSFKRSQPLITLTIECCVCVRHAFCVADTNLLCFLSQHPLQACVCCSASAHLFFVCFWGSAAGAAPSLRTQQAQSHPPAPPPFCVNEKTKRDREAIPPPYGDEASCVPPPPTTKARGTRDRKSVV